MAMAVDVPAARVSMSTLMVDLPVMFTGDDRLKPNQSATPLAGVMERPLLPSVWNAFVWAMVAEKPFTLCQPSVPVSNDSITMGALGLVGGAARRSSR